MSLSSQVTDLATRIATEVKGKVGTSDPRLSDTRTPTDGTVTNAKVATGADISADKLADGTTSKIMTSAERSKLSGIAPTATANRTDGATDSLLNAKAPLASPTFTGTVSGVTKVHVGLGNVDNTADTAKPVSTAQAAADTAAKARANHTGVQATSTVTGLDAALAARALLTQSEGVQTHDGTAGGGARLAGYKRVRWLDGPARPANMITGDVWERDG